MGEEHRTYHWGDQPANQRLTVAQAAEVLGITEGAVRSRIKRGTLRTTKEGGTVYVLLGGGTSRANQAPNTGEPTGQSPELLEALRDQIQDLRDQLEQANERDRENRRIIAALTSRIPAIEASASPEPRESPESPADEQQGRGPLPDAGGLQEPAQRRWWEFWR